MFGLTSDTAFVKRARTPSLEQVRRAEDRTRNRLFALVDMIGPAPGAPPIEVVVEEIHWIALRVVTAMMGEVITGPLDDELAGYARRVATFAGLLDLADKRAKWVLRSRNKSPPNRPCSRVPPLSSLPPPRTFSQ
jgi:hypothetical protein